MPKNDKKVTGNRVTMYLEPSLFERYIKAKEKRAKLIRPAHMSDSEYAGHLVEYGLRIEEKELEEAETKKNEPQKGGREAKIYEKEKNKPDEC